VAAKNDAQAVFAIEPVGNLRQYMKDKAQNQDLSNFFTVDGLITEIPFPNNFADICMGGHVFGDAPEAEDTEMTRVTKAGINFSLSKVTNGLGLRSLKTILNASTGKSSNERHRRPWY
jgi:ubiquinone/menaquinone biosynthesis C-methylase UbiE